jgi:hypothetical protein
MRPLHGGARLVARRQLPNPTASTSLVQRDVAADEIGDPRSEHRRLHADGQQARSHLGFCTARAISALSFATMSLGVWPAQESRPIPA